MTTPVTVGPGTQSPAFNYSTAIAQFNVPYARLTSFNYSITVGSAVYATASNATNTTASVTVSDSDGVSFSNPVGPGTLATVQVSPSGSATLTAGQTGRSISGSDSEFGGGVVTTGIGPYAGSGTLPLTIAAPFNPVRVSGATSYTNASFTVTPSFTYYYTYANVGLTQSDPITPSSVANGVYSFSAVPSGRWFDPAPTSAYQYTVTSAGDSFAGIQGFPTGFGNAFTVTAAGVTYGPFSSGQTLTFPSGVTSFDVSGIEPSVTPGAATNFPIELVFNRDGASFTATAVPEPTTAGLTAVAVAGLLGRRRCRA